jgi:DNA-binding response OmpR family regulator
LADYDVLCKKCKQGVEMATMNLPDIILSDIMMPDLDGYGVLYLLNKNPETTTIPFILLLQNRVDLRKGMEMGADDYLTKPFGRLELLNAIETRLKKRLSRPFYSKSLENLITLCQKNEWID